MNCLHSSPITNIQCPKVYPWRRRKSMLFPPIRLRAGVLFLREVCICDLLLNPFDLYSHPLRRHDAFTQEKKISWPGFNQQTPKIQRSYKENPQSDEYVAHNHVSFSSGLVLALFLPLLLLRFGPKVCSLVLPALFLNQSTSAINPCIYLLYIKSYRCGFREIWRSLYRRCMKTLSSNNKIYPQDISTVRRGTVEVQQ